MTTGEMLGFTKRFNEITAVNPQSNKVSCSVKDSRLRNLMNDLEAAYNIPMLWNGAFNANYPHVMAMYRTVSEARTF